MVAVLAVDVRQAAACSPWLDGIHGRALIPEDGADEVPTNARIAITYDIYDVGLVGDWTLELREQGGGSVAVTLDATSFVGGYVRIMTPTTALTPATTYEVIDAANSPCTQSCIGAPRVIGTFRTGTGADTIPPSIGNITVASSFICNDGTSCDKSPNEEVYDIAVGTIRDDGPTGWIRYEYLDDGVVRAGPTRLLRAGQECSNGGGDVAYHIEMHVDGEFEIRAVDIAGNVETAAHTIVGESCGTCAIDAGPDGTSDAGEDPAVVVDGGAAPASPDAGCCSTHDRGAPGLALVFGLLLRRRRA